MSIIFFDLEGPLATQDNAYELMKLFPNGQEIFEVISRYDDLLTLEKRKGYEPGDTLALIAPFLAYHRIKEKDIVSLAKKAHLTQGAANLIARLKDQGWRVFCISTSYEQYALGVTKRLGILPQNVACTTFPLDRISKTLCKADFALLEAIEGKILGAQTVHDDWIKKTLDRFYWAELPKASIRTILEQVRPMGGQRKVDALNQFAQAEAEPLSNCVVVGDSITDFKMLKAVEQAKGLAIAFNANEYALPHATVGLASTQLIDLWPVLLAWEEGKRTATYNLIKERGEESNHEDSGNLHWLADETDITAHLLIHKRFRNIVRKEAAKLG